jgi:predicted PurR-regulated permease PerM
VQVNQGMSFWANRTETIVTAVWRLLMRIWWRGLLIAGALYGCYRLRLVITTLFIAAIIAYVLDPMVEWLCRQNWFNRLHAYPVSLLRSRRTSPHPLLVPEAPLDDLEAPCEDASDLKVPAAASQSYCLKRHTIRLLAATYVFIFAVVIVWQGTKLTLAPFIAEFKALTSPQTRTLLLEKKDDWLRAYDQSVPFEELKSDKVLIFIQEQFKKSELSQELQKRAGEVGKSVLESLKGVVELVLLPVLAFYLLIDGRRLKHEFAALLPRAHLRETLLMVNEFNRIMRAFIAGQFILCLLAGVVVGLGLAALGVKYPFMLGVLAGITRAIPIIGPIIGGIPIILLTLATKGWGVGLAVLGFFTLLHFLESKLIMPLLIGDRMELHPIIIIVVLLVGGEIGGLLFGSQIGSLLGMFFAAPLTSLARILIRRYWLRIRTRHPKTSHRQRPAKTISVRLPETVE